MRLRRLLAVAALLAAHACARAPAPEGTAADSAAAAGFRALMAAAPGAARYCLALGNPTYYRDPQGGAPSLVAPSPRLLALVAAGRPAGAGPVLDAPACQRSEAAGGVGLAISHLLPLGDSAAHVTATVGSAAGAFMYACRVRRTRTGWAVADSCRRTGVFD